MSSKVPRVDLTTLLYETEGRVARITLDRPERGNGIVPRMPVELAACVERALEHADDGQDIVWDNPDRHARYEVTPTKTYQQNDGRYCREYTSSAIVNGREQTVYGTACRQPDGSWELQS